MAPRRARRDRTVPTIVVVVVGARREMWCWWWWWAGRGARSEGSGREVGPDRGENAGERAARGTELVVVAAAGWDGQRAVGLVVVVRWWW